MYVSKYGSIVCYLRTTGSFRNWTTPSMRFAADGVQRTADGQNNFIADSCSRTSET
ncbi:unnamed protein product, partial [Nesidiocoris tenuis]